MKSRYSCDGRIATENRIAAIYTRFARYRHYLAERVFYGIKKMKFLFNGRAAYVIEEYRGGYVIYDCQGFMCEPEQLIYIANGLKNTAKKYGSEIKAHNEEIENENAREWPCDNYKLEKTSGKRRGYVYMLECGGRYKIGFSADVERRINQLDTRPFELKLIAKSGELSDALQIEQRIHAKAGKYKIVGEWYNFTTETAEKLKNYIENLHD